jgi:hypothetical protein
MEGDGRGEGREGGSEVWRGGNEVEEEVSGVCCQRAGCEDKARRGEETWKRKGLARTCPEAFF